MVAQASSFEPANFLNKIAYKSEIFAYTWQRLKEGASEATLKTHARRLGQLARKCNLLNPEEVKTIIALGKQKNSTKSGTVNAYTDFLKYKGMKWEKPHCKSEATVPFIPLETEIDALIASTSKNVSIFLQLLKETGARGIEAIKTEWIDIDTERKTLKINNAAKGSNPKILPISTKLIGMLNNLPKKSQRCFNGKLDNIRGSFNQQRIRTAKKLNNPRLKQISFHTLRHWKGTMEYHKTRDLYHVKTILGHKSIINTEIYVNLEQATFLTEECEYHSATAKNSRSPKTHRKRF